MTRKQEKRKLKTDYENSDDEDDIEILGEDKEKLQLHLQRMDQSVRLWRNVVDQEINALSGCYFRDGIRKIDLILVITSNTLSDSNDKDTLQNFLTALERYGFEFEDERGQVQQDLIFLKVHCPAETLLNVAKANNFTMLFQNPHFGNRFNGVEINQAVPTITNYSTNKQIRKATELYESNKPNDILNWERSFITHAIMVREFIVDNDKITLSHILHKKLVQIVFPIHDGKWEWTSDGIINDRQLLEKNCTKINFKSQQPIDLIFKYYGPEVGFYFAFYNMYNRMLRVAAIVGAITVLISIPFCYYTDSLLLSDVCESEQIMCPITCDISKNCKYFKMNDRCFEAYVTVLSDNLFSVLFGIFMSCWATVFLAMWRREQSKLMIKWTRFYDIHHLKYREQYLEKNKKRRIWHYTGEKEPFTPPSTLLLRYSIVVVAFSLMIILFVFTVYLNMYLRLELQRVIHDLLPHHVGFFMIIITSFLASVLMILFDSLCKLVAFHMTIYENPRTQTEFDKSYITKSYVLVFFNHNLPLIYIAFVQGRILTQPGQHSSYTFFRRMEQQACYATGCVMKLCIQLAMQIIVKATVKLIIGSLFLMLKERAKRRKLRGIPIAQYEDDYMLKDMKQYHWMMGYMSIAVQYGYVTFFVTVFPLAPVLAYLFNSMDIKLQALKRIRYFKRPVPKRVIGIETWNEIFTAITILGSVVNALTIAFTTDFITRSRYRITTDTRLHGYLNTTLTEFDTNDYEEKSPFMEGSDVKYCWFKGKRYPFDHEKKYQLNEDHWRDMLVRAFFVIIFEHILLALLVTLLDAIPPIPYSIKKEVAYEEKQKVNTKNMNADKWWKRRKKPYILPNVASFTSEEEEEEELTTV